MDNKRDCRYERSLLLGRGDGHVETHVSLCAAYAQARTQFRTPAPAARQQRPTNTNQPVELARVQPGRLVSAFGAAARLRARTHGRRASKNGHLLSRCFRRWHTSHSAQSMMITGSTRGLLLRLLHWRCVGCLPTPRLRRPAFPPFRAVSRHWQGIQKPEPWRIGFARSCFNTLSFCRRGAFH
jgi:hypothetical protein